jgi:hypothetical protein
VLVDAGAIPCGGPGRCEVSTEGMLCAATTAGGTCWHPGWRGTLVVDLYASAPGQTLIDIMTPQARSWVDGVTSLRGPQRPQTRRSCETGMHTLVAA